MKEKETRTIGIAGSVRGSGVTHLSVALANYAAGGRNEAAAYLELFGHGQMAHWKNTNEIGYFTEHKIHYYPDVCREEIPILLNRGYEKIIMDFGDAYEEFRGEILRCDRKIFLLNLNPWQEFSAGKMVKTLKKDDWGGIEPLYASANAVDCIQEKIEKEYGIKVNEIPAIPNPRHIGSEYFTCLDAIFGCPAVKKKRKKLLIPIRRNG